MNIAKIEECVQQVVKDFSPETFIYELLEAYGKPKASITRLQKGNLNLSKILGEIIWKKNLLFHPVNGTDLHTTIDHLRKNELVVKHSLRFVIVTDYKTLLAVDTKTTDTLDIPIKDLPKYFDFFLPWAGQEKHQSHSESQADIKAAYRMARLYDEICKDNPGMNATARHSLNVFLSRLLFCFFAEDTAIFSDGIFINSIASHTQEDGSDLQSYLDKVFEVMNTKERSSYATYLQAFPYVNGGLFADRYAAPNFSRRSRKIILECGELNWSEINPDIFGSMIQAVVYPDERSRMGMHYTSVSNIMKVIEPLFLNELRESFEENQDSTKELKKLLERLYNIKIFDPACGSGNFLIISYKELRYLEMQVYQRLRVIDDSKGIIFLPKIRLTQFYGIEIDDFAHEIATLSLWLAEHQMNVKFKQNLGILVPALPLKPSGHIVCANATSLDWGSVCPKDEKSEIYVLGNPPYSGSRNQNKEQKEEMKHIFAGWDSYKDLDYIACWFVKGSDYIQDRKAKLAFVSTNSICQGTQVALLWPRVFKKSLEIGFTYRPFKWENNAKHNAGVTVTIVGIRTQSDEPKYIFDADTKITAQNINGYLSNAKNIAVERSSEPISKLPKMYFGSMPNDGGNLILSKQERDDLLLKYPSSCVLIKRFIGSQEFINGQERWCLKIDDDKLKLAESIPPIATRLERITQIRSKSTEKSTRALAENPHRFYFSAHQEGTSIIVPSVSSERRVYVPIGFLDSETVINNLAYAIYHAETWLFAVISSKMHNVWIRAVGGRLEERIRYSVGLCYNTFPIPDLSDKQKDTLQTHTFNVINEREKYPEKTTAQRYDPDKMPAGLRQAHHELDVAVERCYRSKPFTSDEERLEYLFKLYEEMTQIAPRGKIHA